MISNAIVVQQVVLLLEAKGISEIIVSPGSRNAPLSISLNQNPFFNCKVVPDERVAAFIGLGVAQATRKPVALVCTSGTALLNYYSAVAEADYQHIPLVVISADRPAEWVDHGDGQTIRQVNAISNHVRYEVQLNRNPTTAMERWYNERELNMAINIAWKESGPVHINVPLQEPLYNLIEEPTVEPKVITAPQAKKTFSQSELKHFEGLINQSKRILVLVGQHVAEPSFAADLRQLAISKQIVVMAETTSNVQGDGVNACIDRTIDGLSNEELSALQPDLLITLGGAIISKKIKAWLRAHPPKEHAHIGPNAIDMFMALTWHLDIDSAEIIGPLQQTAPEQEWVNHWNRKQEERKAAHNHVTVDLPYSDLAVFQQLNEALPNDLIVQQGNSSVVRYMQLFDWNSTLWFYGNRGTSGIDGSSSTAVGYALYTDKPVLVITGDVSFFYDSNAFYHKHVPNNVKVLLINNRGGGIFRIINGPSDTEELDDFFEATHDFKAAGIADAYGLAFNQVMEAHELEAGLQWLFNQPKAAILEVQTPREVNDQVLADYFSQLKQYPA